jgi:hypothetical protein
VRIVQQAWFEIVWPFIGLGGAVVMLAVMLTTNTFRGRTSVSRLRDPVWLGWLAAPVYWIHQFEEYCLPTIGLEYSIQQMVCKAQGYQPYPNCPIPLSFYPTVNIALMWVGAPLAAHLGRRNVAVGLSFWGLILLNGTLHTSMGLVLRDYNPGMLSGIVFTLLCAWVIYACAIRGPYSGKVVGLALTAGVLAHVALGLAYVLLKLGVYGTAGMLIFSVAVGFTPILFAALGSRFIALDALGPVAER